MRELGPQVQKQSILRESSIIFHLNLKDDKIAPHKYDRITKAIFYLLSGKRTFLINMDMASHRDIKQGALLYVHFGKGA